MTLHILSLMSHYSKCMVIKVHFSHFVCVSGVAFLRLTDKSLRHLPYIKYQFQTKIYLNKKQTTLEKVGFILRNSQLFLTYPRNSSGGRQIIIWRPPDNSSGGRQIIYLFWRPPDKLSGGRQITLLATAR